MIDLNTQQLAAAKHPPGPLLILAGAGTGKTTTIVGRMAHLIQNEGADPTSILTLTYTIDAAEHLKNKLVHDIGVAGSEIHSCTFHSFAQSKTNQYYRELGYSELPMVMNRGDIYYLLRRRFDELRQLRSTLFRRSPVQAIQCFQKVFDAFRQNLLSNTELVSLKKRELAKLNDALDEKAKEQIFQLADIVDVYPQYQDWKKENNWIDYGDMISNLWELIQSNPAVLAELQAQYKHVIVDEFQDNNYALSRIVEKIALPENSITVVGDDDQCIYAFRQANIQNVHQFQDHYYDNSHEPVQLMQNYRSNQPILNVANWVIAKNPGRMAKKELTSEIRRRKRPELYIGNPNQQLYKLREDISVLLNEGEFAGNIIILLRTHTKCRQVSAFLKSYGINTYYHADKLYEQPIIKDLLAMLNIWGETEKADHGFLRLLLKKIASAGFAEFTQKYSRDKPQLSLIEYALTLKNEFSKTAGEIIKPITSVKAKDAGELLWSLINIGKPYKQNSKIDSLQKKLNWQALNQFRGIVHNYCQSYTTSDLADFLYFIDVQWEVNDDPLTPLPELAHLPAVRVMTVHGAKGMEFKHVFIPFLRSGSFPLNYRSMNMVDRLPVSWQRWNSGDRTEKELHYEEERRLFYVAVTRAMKSLTLFAPEKIQSPFIKEISSELADKEKIMIEEKELTKFDELIGNYQSRLQSELNLGHFETANHLLEAIENIAKIKRSDSLDWGSNPLKNETIQSLAEKESLESIKNPSLSATSIQTYANCPLKYKYRYIDGIPGAPEKVYFQLGKVIHKVLEIYHEEEHNTLEELMLLLDQHW